METRVAAEECTASNEMRRFDVHPGRETSLGALPIWRALPLRGRRLIGPWCFLDRYGPLSFTSRKPMDVAPHPHIGLQTVSWLFSGEVIHHDSLGFDAIARPGGVNVMTAGAGIAHSEETPRENSGQLDGVQLWVALPEASRDVAPSFQHVGEVPRMEMSSGVVQLFSGTHDGMASPAAQYSDIVGLDVAVHRGEALELPVAHEREHGLFVISGSASFEGQPLEPNTLYYLGCGRSSIALASSGGARLLLLGGVPFAEKILMWWNFVARTAEEMAVAREEWESGAARFGTVRAYAGPRIAAPALSRIAPPNPAS